MMSSADLPYGGKIKPLNFTPKRVTDERGCRRARTDLSLRKRREAEVTRCYSRKIGVDPEIREDLPIRSASSRGSQKMLAPAQEDSEAVPTIPLDGRAASQPWLHLPNPQDRRRTKSASPNSKLFGSMNQRRITKESTLDCCEDNSTRYF